jgi:alpha-tubulin suppressor-like RCC1 family protein
MRKTGGVGGGVVLLLLIALAAIVLGFGDRRVPPAEASGVSAVSAGGDNVCALTTLGGVRCWGDNLEGQLGDGTNPGPQTCPSSEPCSTIPVDVSGLASGVTGISMGFNHACALTSSGGVKCWGFNNDGELGDGSQSWRFTPVDVVGLTSGVASVSAGGYHTCALTTAGGVKCWGLNFYGELGNSTTTNSSVPVDVTGLTSGVAAVSAGYLDTCALTITGGIKCWGRNAEGQLGNGTTTGPQTCGPFACSNAPVDVLSLTSGVAAVSAGGEHTCALTTGGGAKCWGANGGGQLGDGTTTGHSTPVGVSGLASAVATISAGDGHTCALTTGGGVKCWGVNRFGELGDGTNTGPQTCYSFGCSTVPVDVSGLTSGAASVSAGEAHTCALTIEGDVKCWGLSDSGELGNGTAIGPEICDYPHYCSTVPLDVVAAVKVLPTPTPPSVGGFSIDPSAGALPSAAPKSSANAWPLAEILAGVTAGALSLGGAAWYTRRRRLR